MWAGCSDFQKTDEIKEMTEWAFRDWITKGSLDPVSPFLLNLCQERSQHCILRSVIQAAWRKGPQGEDKRSASSLMSELPWKPQKSVLVDKLVAPLWGVSQNHQLS